MNEIVFTDLKPKLKERSPKTTVSERRVRDGEGRRVTLRTLDVASGSFGDDLQLVFDRNVAKARRENREIDRRKNGAD